MSVRALSLTAMMLAIVTPAVAGAESYDCVFDGLYSVNPADDGLTVTAIGFPNSQASDWQFTLHKTRRNLEVTWLRSPIGLEGKERVIETGSNTFAAFFAGGERCMFVDMNCGAILHYAEQVDGSLIFQYQPIAARQFAEDAHVEPFNVHATGKCTQIEDSQ